LLFYINIDSKENIRIGRGYDSDIRISDITVSRFHAIISKTKNDTLILQDNNSKFGTLALLRNPNLYIQEESIYLQIGRSLIGFYVQAPFNLFSCFSEKNKDKSLDYNQLNHEYVDKEKIIVIKNIDEIDEKNEESFISIAGLKQEKTAIKKDNDFEKNKTMGESIVDDMNIAEESDQFKELTIKKYKFIMSA